MGITIFEPRQTYIQSNAEPEEKLLIAVVWMDGEAIRKKGRLGGRVLSSTVVGRPSEN
jgi:hypothetical protein